jgi:hypothetical protein
VELHRDRRTRWSSSRSGCAGFARAGSASLPEKNRTDDQCNVRIRWLRMERRGAAPGHAQSARSSTGARSVDASSSNQRRSAPVSMPSCSSPGTMSWRSASECNADSDDGVEQPRAHGISPSRRDDGVRHEGPGTASMGNDELVLLKLKCMLNRYNASRRPVTRTRGEGEQVASVGRQPFQGHKCRKYAAFGSTTRDRRQSEPDRWQ